MDQYYGADKIMGVVVLEETTPGEAEMVEVLFESGEKFVTSKQRFDLLVTEEPSDATEIQGKVNARVGALCYSLLHEYDVVVGEVNGVADAMVALVTEGHKKAASLLFGQEYLDIPLLGINKILYKNAQENNDGASPEGSESDKADKE